jgi:hypothetical protein
MVTKFTLTLKEDSAGGNTGAVGAAIEAHAVKDFFTDGITGAPYSQRPSLADNTPVAKGVRASDGTWTFDLTALAALWAAGTIPNNGVGLIPSAVAMPPSTFEVVWSGTSPATSGTFAPPAATPTTVSTANTGSSAAVPEAPAVGTSAVEIAPSATPPANVPSSPFSPIAAPTIPRAATTPTRTAAHHHHPGPTLAFWLAVLAVLALAASAVVALGDLGDPVPPRRGGVLRTLERRLRPPDPQEVG